MLRAIILGSGLHEQNRDVIAAQIQFDGEGLFSASSGCNGQILHVAEDTVLAVPGYVVEEVEEVEEYHATWKGGTFDMSACPTLAQESSSACPDRTGQGTS